MNLLFIHQGLPGQYKFILHELAKRPEHKLVGVAIQPDTKALPTGMQLVTYRPTRNSNLEIHPWASDLETKVIRAEACARACHQLAKHGFTPDLICGHPGWGEMLMLESIWPNTPILAYQEFFYRFRGFDFDFDPEFQGNRTLDDFANIKIKTANPLLNLQSSFWNVSPTRFQRDSYPEEWHKRFSVIHDGVNTELAKPGTHTKKLQLPDGTLLQPGEPIVTFVNRTLEPYRGCHTFIRSIPYIQQLHPSARLVIVGETKGVSYGSRCPDGEWKDFFLREIEGKFDPSRVHFTGALPYTSFVPLLQLSAAHVYLTYPFVLSWSLLEAMSTECAIVGSNTAPVREVIEHGRNGLLVDFFKPQDLAEAIAELLRNPEQAQQLGSEARKTVLQHYSLSKCLPRHLHLMDLVASGALGGKP